MQTCPGFFFKSLLEYPGNLLEICSVKSVDTLYCNTAVPQTANDSVYTECIADFLTFVKVEHCEHSLSGNWDNSVFLVSD